jgi:1,4-alpha-glucan branching enzyme
MGWMHDMLDYFELDPWFRQFHQNNVTFSIWYAFTENFMLALSHDEVVHGKSHLLHKMPGDDWQKFANVRALLAYMWTHPGKKTIFMGMEFGQRAEWNVWGDLQWDLLEHEPHQALQRMVDDLNAFYKSEPALWGDDFSEYGFQWIDCNDSQHSVISFMRRESNTGCWVVVVANFTPQTHSHYRVGVPLGGFYTEAFNTDASRYGGCNLGNLGGKFTNAWGMHSYENSLELCLPPLSVLVFRHDPARLPELEEGTEAVMPL